MAYDAKKPTPWLAAGDVLGRKAGCADGGRLRGLGHELPRLLPQPPCSAPAAARSPSCREHRLREASAARRSTCAGCTSPPLRTSTAKPRLPAASRTSMRDRAGERAGDRAGEQGEAPRRVRAGLRPHARRAAAAYAPWPDGALEGAPSLASADASGLCRRSSESLRSSSLMSTGLAMWSFMPASRQRLASSA